MSRILPGSYSSWDKNNEPKKFQIGDRVIHSKTNGRIRGKIVRIRVEVEVDGISKNCEYDANNIELE